MADRWSDAFGPRTTGRPTSSNGASSFHLRWLGLPSDTVVLAAAVTLEVVVAPVVPDLFFWALQASFVGDAGTTGAGHLGLQWYQAHPGGTAVNWGGYSTGGGELDGTVSELPSGTGNVNSRDFSWEQGRPYRISISRGSTAGSWRGMIDGVVVRELHGGGSALADVMVWSEVFAPCDAPTVVVRWSDLELTTPVGTIRPDRLSVSYQSRVDGGCDNTSVRVGAGMAEQITNTLREVPAGAVLPL